MKNIRILKLVPAGLMLFSSLYLVYLYASGKNAFYISPSYYIFNFILSLILLLISLGSLFKRVELQLGWKQLSIILFLIVILLVPAKPLSSETATQRSGSFGLVAAEEAEVSPLLIKDPRTLNISDWVKLKNYDPNIARLAGQPVSVIGFVYRLSGSGQMYSSDNFLVGRFVISCCAVDATPVGLEVDNSEDILADKNLNSDDWVKLEGEWVLKNRDGMDYLVVSPTSIERIEAPSAPYE